MQTFLLDFSILIDKSENLFFAEGIFLGFADKTDADTNAFFIRCMEIEFVFMSDVALVISDIFHVFDGHGRLEEFSEIPQEFRKSDRKIFSLIVNVDMVFHDAFGSEIFLGNNFRQEFVIRYDKKLSGILPIFVFSHESDTKHSNEYDLSLYSSYADCETDRILRCHKKEGDDGYEYILESDDDCTGRDRKKSEIESGIRDEKQDNHEYERHDTD